ncbi:T9SS type A sorting domain-containing protein [Chryseobacterium sp. RRHN12]|uniref:T9SS type A sorting domain-containing protein n=1 Tax=Chryseobacterium sp. RRHN12 TaxID=3437884 RepID=UPI003D9AC5E7
MKNTTHLLCLFCLFFFPALHAQEKNTYYQIGITTGVFTPEISSGEKFKKKNTEIFDHTYFRILQFYSIPDETVRKEWEKKGLTLTDYLPGNAYFAIISIHFDLNQIQSLIRAVLPVDNRFKLEESVYYKGIPPHAMEGSHARLTVTYYKGLDVDKISSALGEKKIKITALHQAVHQIDIQIEPQRLNELAAMPFVQFISAVPAEPIPEAYAYDYRNANNRSNYLNSGYNGLNYNGSGITLAVGESGALINEPDAKGRVILEQVSGGPSGHKTVVMSSMAGAGNLAPSNRNQAWGSHIVSTHSNTDYAGLFDSHQLLYTNHSFGYGVDGGYNALSRTHDLLLGTYPKHLVAYSSGNKGTSTGYAPYELPNWGNITGAPKMSKNMVTVGGLSELDMKNPSSSNGPMYDGRIAPQIVVEGAEGTSYASPKFVGMLGMLAQAYKAQHADEVPASSLLRAIVFNTADDIENPGPDFKTGYGRINTRRAYDLMSQNQFLTSDISNQQTKQHTIPVPPNTRQVRVMIVWPDVAAAVNANPAIVNDLDLVLKDPLNNTYNPWVLDTSLPSSEVKLNAPAVRGTDHINTIEQVTVDNPAPGSWTIEVSGFNIPSGPQPYYIAYEFLKDEVKFMYPLQGDHISSTEEYQLKWDSFGAPGTFTLEYQLNNGPWMVIIAGYDASERNFSWKAPMVNGVQPIKFRVKRGNLISESGINYIGPLVENFRVQKVCNDQVTLRWSVVNGATSYKIYRLGARYMEEVTSDITFTGNTAVLTGQNITGKEYYTISPLTGTLEGRKVLTITKEAGDFHCQGVQWTGTVSTDWFNIGNWASGSLPTANTDIIIPASAPYQPMIANTGAVCANLTIDQGASLSMDTASSFTLSVGGDWINNGTFNSGIGTVVFTNTNTYQEISGNSKTDFYTLKVAKGSTDNILEATSLIGLTAANNPLVISSGTFKLSSASTIRPFTTAGGAFLNSVAKLWINGGTVNYDNISWWYNAGEFKISGGTVNMGTNSNVSISYYNNGTFIIEGGTLNMNGSLAPYNATASSIYSQSGGTVNLKSTISYPSIDFNPNSSFSMSGGTIRITNRSGHPEHDMRIMSNKRDITGGTIQIGDDTTPANQVIRIRSAVPLHNLVIHSHNTPTAKILNDHFTVRNNVNINGGNLDANGFNINVGGHWSNNGSFTANAGKVTLNGKISQNLAGNIPTTFYNLELSNSNGIHLNGSVNAVIHKELTLTSGVITTGSNRVIIGTDGSVSRTSGHVFGELQKTIPAGANIRVNFETGDAEAANYTPVFLEFSSVTASGSLTANTINTDHPSISASVLNPAQSVNRYWMLRNSGISFTGYNATFNFLPGDLDPSTQWNTLAAGQFNTPVWNYPTVGEKTSSSIQVLNVSSFGDFQFAEGSTFLNVGDTAHKNDGVILYPNPVTDLLYFSTVKTIEKIEIYTAAGNWITSFNQPQSSISLKGLPEAVYILKIYTDHNQEMIIKKVIKK